LSNAIKYNVPGGQVRVRAERMANEVRVDISDTGSGLTPLQQAELFQPFNRLGAQNTKAEGSGLGLVITRHLLALMGGSVSVQSLAGQGSTFSFVLPAQGLASAQTADAEPVALLPEVAPGVAAQMPSMARGNVLCVEDNAVNAVLMEAIIEMRPAITLLMVRDGASALAALASFDPDLLLLDMHLPDTTGTQLLAAMRQQEPGCRAPAVVVSAAARGEDIQRALNAGFAGYWTKPLDIDRTLAELDRLLGG
jgi:CheY-like chemotaxis protein